MANRYVETKYVIICKIKFYLLNVVILKQIFMIPSIWYDLAKLLYKCMNLLSNKIQILLLYYKTISKKKICRYSLILKNLIVFFTTVKFKKYSKIYYSNIH